MDILKLMMIGKMDLVEPINTISGKVVAFSLLFVILVLPACERRYPGYEISLFHGTIAEDLAIAVEKENISEMSIILNRLPQIVDFQEGKFGSSLLMYAIVNKKYRAAKKLVEQGADPNLLDKQNQSALMIACSFIGNEDCNTELVAFLLENGGDVQAVQEFHETNEYGQVSRIKRNLVNIAISNGCLDLVKLVVESGADVNFYSFETYQRPVRQALMLEKMEIAKYLIIDKNANIPHRFSVGYYDGQKNKEVNVFQYLAQESFSTSRVNQVIKEEIISHLKSHPDQFVDE